MGIVGAELIQLRLATGKYAILCTFPLLREKVIGAIHLALILRLLPFDVVAFELRPGEQKVSRKGAKLAKSLNR